MSRRAQTSHGRASTPNNGSSSMLLPQMPYTVGSSSSAAHQQQHQRPQTSHRLVDKSSIVWRDFLNGVKRRKHTLHKLREVAVDGAGTSGLLKRLLLEIRQMTLRIIEDALEIEYRSQFPAASSSPSVTAATMLRVGSSKIPLSGAMQLPPLQSFRGIEDKQDILALCDMITDVDDLFHVPNVRVFLPVDFPQQRNPFLLGKTVDELATMQTPQPAAGNLEEELRVLELMRYKRAAKALIKAEAQVLNRLPITLQDVERLYYRMADDPHTEKLVRSVATLLANTQPDFGQEAVLFYLTESTLSIEPYDFLNRLNGYRGGQAIRPDVQAAVRRFLRDVPLEFMEDQASVYLIEWVNAVLSNSQIYPGTSSGYIAGSPNQGGSFRPSASDAESIASFRQSNVGNKNSILSIKDSPTRDRQPYIGDMASVVSGLDAPNSTFSTFNESPPRGRPQLGSLNGGGATLSMKKSLNMASANSGMNASKMLSEMGDDGPSEASATMSHLKSIIAAPVSIQSGSQRKSKKKKETDKERKKRERDDNGEYIRGEVERILQEQGIGKRPNTGQELVTDENTLTSLRYELVKMQQELLRRKVLDPRHYRVASVDTASLEQHGLTIPDGGGLALITAGAKSLGNVQEPEDGPKITVIGGKRKSKAPPRLVSVTEIEVALTSGRGVIEVLLDMVDDALITSLNRTYETDFAGNEVDVLRVQQNEKLPKKNREVYTKHKELMATMRISKLIFNRTTNLVLDSLIEEKSSEMRNMKLTPFIEQMRQYTSHAEPHAVTVVPKADRRLFKTVGPFDGVTMEVTITRSEDCNSVSIVCVPKGDGVGAVDAGPVSLALNDRELQVLLINQRGLYTLAQSKWSALEMVAQWVSSRIRVRSVRVLGAGEAVPKPETQAQKDAAKRKKFLEDGGSPAAGGLFSPIKSPLGAIGVQAQDARSQAVVASLRGDFADMAPGGRKPVMLDVYIDRDVEVAKEALKQWKARNVPNITDMTVTLSARQDLDLLKFEIALTFPPPRQRMLKQASEGGGADGLVDFNAFNATEEAGGPVDDTVPVVVTLNHRLTCSELLTFGTADPLEGVKLSMSTKGSGEGHPSAFMWNVLLRMQCVFAGSTSQPFSKQCKADDRKNWELKFDRRLFRDIRSISGGVVMVTASAVGDELVYDCEPTEGSTYTNVGRKVMSAEELQEMVYTEGWPLSLLAFPARAQLAFRVLEKLKIVFDQGAHRLEPYNFPESRMIQIAQQGASGNIPLGVVEISDHFTLGDLRVIIRHELDREIVPRLYRFMYKGGPCAVRQEPFRRAWECLPTVILIPRINKPDGKEAKAQEEREKKARDLNATLQKSLVKLAKNQRRAPGKLVPVPLPTLARLQEDTGEVYLLHDHRPYLTAGDVVRFGNVLGRDYIISIRSKALQNSAPQTIQIDPVYDLVGEEDFDAPTMGRSLLAAGPAVDARGRAVIPPYTTLGLGYVLPPSKRPVDLSSTLDGQIRMKGKGGKVVTERTVGNLKGAGGEAALDEELDASHVRAGAPRAKGQSAEEGNVWTDVWMWKCIPAEEDKRPPWRIAYDNGLVKYDYEYKDSNAFSSFFRVKASMRLMEAFCTDMRCPDMTIYAQRAQMMESFEVDFYTKLAFKMTTEWYPQYKRGVEMSKFMKMMREMQIFPDIKKPARVAQLDLLFAKEAQSENGINDKYVNYVGLCRLLQDVALLRYPPPVANAPIDTGFVAPKENGGANRDRDDRSVGGGSIGGSIGGSVGSSLSSKGGGAPVEAIARGGSVASRASQGSKGSKASKSVTSDVERERDAAKVREAMASNAQALVDPQHAAWAYRTLCVEYVMGVPEWSQAAWAEAKLGCIKRESKRYCGATRIAALIRSWLAYRKFTFFREQLILLQAIVRRRIASRRSRYIRNMLEQDWLFRVRYWAATVCNALVRRFLARCGMFRVMKVRKEAEVKMAKAKRFRLKKIRVKEKMGIIYKETKRVNGVMVMLFISRKDTRNYSKDFGIVIGVYVPKTSTTYKFLVEEDSLRKYMSKELNVEALGVGDLLDKRNLQAVVSSRLIIRASKRLCTPPQVIFSKQAMGQRGAKTMTLGRVIDGEHFVCTLYDSGDDITVTCYHGKTSKIFTCKLGTTALREWIMDDHQKHARTDLERSTQPGILRPDKKLEAYRWAVLRIRVDTRKGSFKCLFECQFHKSRKGLMIRMIQAQWRRAIVRQTKIRWKYDEFLLKVKSHPHPQAQCYYVDRRTGVSSWEKPWLLGPHVDLTEQPRHRWVELYYHHEDAYYVHYVNPWTGCYSHITQDRAARIIQTLTRNKQLRPFLLKMEELKRVMPFVKSSKREYENDPLKLMSVINHALVTHAVNLDEEKGKKLYVEAVGLSEANPLVTRSFGLFVLATCEAPIGPNRARALKLLADAKRRDDTHHKFRLAYLMYKLACLKHPRDVRALCNRALVDCLLYNENWNGERMLRRALSIAPFEPRVIEIWNFLKDRFVDAQLNYQPVARIQGYDSLRGGKKRMVHGRLATECPEWAGWVYIEDDEFKVSKIRGPYWYSPVSGEERVKQPDFHAEWHLRKARSQSNGEKLGLENYFDPLTSSYFHYHALSDTFQ